MWSLQSHRYVILSDITINKSQPSKSKYLLLSKVYLTRVRLYGVLPRFVHTSWDGTDRRGWVFWLRKLRLL